MQRIIHLLSPGVWLRLVLGSLVLATGAGLWLWSPLNAQQEKRIGSTWDAIELFLRDTIRLSFKARNPKGFQDIAYVAPIGILDKTMTFKWIDPVAVSASTASEQTQVAPALAPLRLLDATWSPDFTPPTTEKDAQ
jgi:hypothetical protein